jgi:hypothetical protein
MFLFSSEKGKSFSSFDVYESGKEVVSAAAAVDGADYEGMTENSLLSAHKK